MLHHYIKTKIPEHGAQDGVLQVELGVDQIADGIARRPPVIVVIVVAALLLRRLVSSMRAGQVQGGIDRGRPLL